MSTVEQDMEDRNKYIEEVMSIKGQRIRFVSCLKMLMIEVILQV